MTVNGQSNGVNGIKRPVKVANFGGFNWDVLDALKIQAESSGADLLFSDSLAELNIAWYAMVQKDNPELGYETRFVRQLDTAADVIAAKGLKVITNAGALNPKGLATACADLLKRKGLTSIKVAYCQGDDVTGRIKELQSQGETFEHLEDQNRPLSSWELKPLTANAYVGARAVVAALKGGADLIITGRTTDATAPMAAAVWWHGWNWTDYTELAGSLLCGHCIECGSYVTGGNFSGFKKILDSYYNFGLPIAEIAHDGTFVVTMNKSPGRNGFVSTETVRAQLLYEIQGNIYLNPDVQADIKQIKVVEDGPDRVRVSNVKGFPPPETTKVSVTALSGYQAEATVLAVGLDIEEKFKALQLQVEQAIGKERRSKFTLLDFTQYGQAKADPQSEAEATAYLRVLAQAPTMDAFTDGNFMLDVLSEGLGHFPGMSWNMDMRLAIPKMYMDYWPARLHQNKIKLKATLLHNDQSFPVDALSDTHPVIQQTDEDASSKYDSSKYGLTVRGPLGWIVHGKSGDKGGNVNCGLFVRHSDEYEWLRTLLSKQKMIELLATEYVGDKMERVEFPHMLAVHFVFHDYLGTGVACTKRLDNLGKGTAEYLRARYVDIPTKFLARGKI